MKGDFSRLLFEEKQHYRGVLMQMGRVLTDNDQNAVHLIHEHLDRTTDVDVIGVSGIPDMPADQFRITSAGGGDLKMGAGRAYINGLLCECEGTTLLTQPQSPYGATLAQVSDLKAPGIYLAYLDVWERHVTSVEDPRIKETALGGPDSTTRVQTVWQLKLVRVGAPGDKVTCPSAAFLPAALSTGKMTASVSTSAPPPNSCAIVPQTGYLRLENQLYRVEIHNSGKQSAGVGEQQATFKWSRDNASVLAAVLSGGGAQQFPVDSLGRDDELGFATDQWVELIDTAAEYSLGRGELRKIANTVTQSREIVLTSAAPGGFGTNAALIPRIRRWDQTGGSEVADGIPLNQAPGILLENGVSVSFSPGDYQAGDYWLIPARTALGDTPGSIEWPRDTAGSFLQQSARGIRHQFAALALVDYDGKNFVEPAGGFADCRNLFAPLTQPQRVVVQDEGSTVAITNTLNFVGAGVTAAFDAVNKRVNISIPGGGDCCGERTPTLLLFPFVSNQAGADATISIVNSTAAPFGPPASGLVRVYFFGFFASGVPTPGLVGFRLTPGQMAVFTLSGGGSVVNSYPIQSIPPTVGFQGYLIAECDFPGAYGFAQVVNHQTAASSGYTAIVLPPRDVRCKTDFPVGFIPLTGVPSISGPDSHGDFVAVGKTTPDNLKRSMALSLPEYVDQLYCGYVQLAPTLSAVAYVQSESERAGNFSHFGAPILDPNTGGPFAGNIIPASLLGGVMAWRFRSSAYSAYGVAVGIGANLI